MLTLRCFTETETLDCRIKHYFIKGETTMKKLIVAIFLISTMISLISCNNAPTKTAVAIDADEYTALVYSMGAGSISDSSTPMYTGKKFGKREEYKKSETEIEKKRETSFFGKQKTVWYGHTWKNDELGYEVDKYSFQNDGKTLFTHYNNSTGKLVRYVSRPANNRSYSSPVNPGFCCVSDSVSPVVSCTASVSVVS